MKRILILGASLLGSITAWAQPSNAPAPTGSPMMVFDATSYDFGKVMQGDIIHHDFVVSNAGTATLRITDVHPGCGCTTAGAWPHELEPGQSGKIPIQVNSKNLPNAVSKTVTVTSNDKHPVVLKISGQVVKPIDLQPSFAMFHLISGATNATASVIKISNRTENPMKITGAKSDSGAFSVSEVRTLAEGKDFEISVEANPPYEHGSNGNILVSTDWSNYVVRIPAYLTVQPAIMAQPHTITLPVHVEHTQTNKVTLYSVKPEDQFSDPKCSDDRIEVTLTNSSAGRPVYTLAAIVPAGYEAPAGHAPTITVKTSNPQNPVVTIPIYQSAQQFGARQPATLRARQPLPPISSAAAAPPPPPAPAGTAAHQ